MAPAALPTSSSCTASVPSRDRVNRPCLPLLAGFLVAAAWLPPAAWAQAPAEEPGADAADAAYSRDGADTCIKCHDDPEVLALFKTMHGSRADPHSPFAAGSARLQSAT